MQIVNLIALISRGRGCRAFILMLLMLIPSSAFAALFKSAKPVWPQGRETEKNLFVGFHANFTVTNEAKVWLRATGATLYRVYVNGEFIAHGPARGPHGFYRVDELDLTPKLHGGQQCSSLRGCGL